MNMTPEEKWKRLTNPKTLEDFGLSVTEAELETFPDGCEILAGFRQVTAERAAQTAICGSIGERMARTQEEIFLKAMRGGKVSV